MSRKIACRVQCQDCGLEEFLRDVPLDCPICHSPNLIVEKM
jgi:Zn finger protein HypA/HybF involved in hydrogenase expression